MKSSSTSQSVSPHWGRLPPPWWTPVARSLTRGYTASDTFSLGLILALMHHKGAFPSVATKKMIFLNLIYITFHMFHEIIEKMINPTCNSRLENGMDYGDGDDYYINFHLFNQNCRSIQLELQFYCLLLNCKIIDNDG